MPTKKHEWIVAGLIAFLRVWAVARSAGTVLGSGYKIRIDDRRAVMPDVVFIRRGRGALAGEQGMEGGAPDLVVEVISPGSSRRDRIIKLGYYAKLGVPEYWLIDSLDDSLERLTLGPDGRYVIADTLEGDAVFSPPSFEGLEIPLRELWNVPQD